MTASSDANSHRLTHAQQLQRKAELERLELQIKTSVAPAVGCFGSYSFSAQLLSGCLFMIRHATGRFDHWLALAYSPMLGYLLLPGIAGHFRLRILSRLIELEAPDYPSKLREHGLI